MKVFVAGASGAIGKQLVPRLLEHGHVVTGTTRSAAGAAALWDMGARPAVLDALDRDAVVKAVVEAAPDVVVHELTALRRIDFRKFEKSFELTDALRTRGTDNLLAGAHAAGATRFVAQSYAGWPYARDGARVKTEDDPLDPQPAPEARRSLDAINHLEQAVMNTPGIDGIVLRYGSFYGPGTGLEPDGEQLRAVERRKFPLVGGGRAVWSFVHIEDAAAATVAAIEGGRPGIYNVVDDEPAPVAEWLPYLAEVAGAKPPHHLPLWVGRLVGGRHMVVLMNEAAGASNEKARRELGWEPARRSWRDGFRQLLAA